jgi:hypothetical protein
MVINSAYAIFKPTTLALCFEGKNVLRAVPQDNM